MCNHTLNDFVPYWRGYTSLSGGDFIDCLEECFMCMKCGKIYTEREFDTAFDTPLKNASAESIADNCPPGAR